jgi:hypothetical protein
MIKPRHTACIGVKYVQSFIEEPERSRVIGRHKRRQEVIVRNDVQK